MREIKIKRQQNWNEEEWIFFFLIKAKILLCFLQTRFFVTE